MSGWLVPDEVLLRRFGFVRSVGGAAYFVAFAVMLAVYGTRVWPLALGVPILAVVTTWYFHASAGAPRLTTAVSLLADAVVLFVAGLVVGGTGSGMLMLQAIVIVSAGILLGPLAGAMFTGLAVVAGAAQLSLEQAGLTPALLHRGALDERLVIAGVSMALLVSVGFLTATYASRLHELVVRAGAEAEVVRRRGRRRRQLVRRASVDVRAPLRDLEDVAEALAAGSDAGGPHDRARLAARLRMSVARVDAEVGRLTDLGVLGADSDSPPEPVSLRDVVDDCAIGLGERLEAHVLDVDVPTGVKVLGDRRGARRVVLSLLENLVEHTPAGTHGRLHVVTSGGQAVLVLTDDGPGVAPEQTATLFDAPENDSAARVGLPLVAELCRQMGAECRYEPGPAGGARFMVAFRLAPSAAPTLDDAGRTTPAGS